MIDYERTEWFGLSYLFQLRGSVLPRCLPAMLLGMAISAAVEVADGYYGYEVLLGDKCTTYAASFGASPRRLAEQHSSSLRPPNLLLTCPLPTPVQTRCSSSASSLGTSRSRG